MSTSQANPVAAAAVTMMIMLLLVDFPATSAFSHGPKGSGDSSTCISRRMLPGKDGSGCESESTKLASDEPMPFRSLRIIPLIPPSPISGKRKSQNAPAPPGQIQ